MNTSSCSDSETQVSVSALDIPSHKRLDKHPDALPDMRALNAFVRLAQNGSFHQTAQGLQISTSALSQTIRALEQQLGHVLFDRSTRPVVPTRIGEQLLPQVQRLLNEARALNQRMKALSHNTPKNLRLGCVDSFAATVGPALIRGLTTHDSTVQLYSGLTPDIGRQLLEHRIDFAITSDPQIEHADLNCTPLFEESWLAVFANDQIPKQSLNSSADLRAISQNRDFVRYSQRSRIGLEIERFVRHHGIRAPRRFEFDGTDTLLSLVAANMGWAITTPLCLLQARHYLSPVDVIPLTGAVSGHRTFYLLSRQDVPTEQAALLQKMTRDIVCHQLAPAFDKQITNHAKLSHIRWL
ncbi:LysR family transcriptional regulator [Orrella sp. 11846]|uniref:LysR family transcriptional regulator n=1 Tax=Orrella sp. 11846 TaxID=3409913 RepID=UPI003B5A77FB